MSSWSARDKQVERFGSKQFSEQLLSRQSTERTQPYQTGHSSNTQRVQTNRSIVDTIREEVAGWRAWVVAQATLTLAVLILNAVLTGLAIKRRYLYPDDSDLATFYVDNCSRTKTVNLVIKLGINALATCLLGASNYCMQVLISPLREEVDRAHDKQYWLFVGVPNVRNFMFIGYKRRIIWAALFVTSIPLHLLWNSAVVHTVVTNDYYVAGVSEEFIEGAPSLITPYNTQPWFVGETNDLQNFLNRARYDNLTYLTAQQSLDAYTVNFADEYSNLVMVMNTSNTTNSLLFSGTYLGEIRSPLGLGVTWPCGFPAPNANPCAFNYIQVRNATHWLPIHTIAGTAFEKNDTYLTSLANVPVSYCIAETPKTQCRLSASPDILIVVLICNAVKLFGVCVTWFYADSKEDRCITSGELIASYLRRPDPRFYNRCLAGVDFIKKYPSKFWDFTKPLPMTWKKQKIRSWKGVPKLIWMFYIIPACLGTIALLGIFLGYGLQHTLYTGFGIPSLNSTLPWQSRVNVVKATLVANLPQLLASYIYIGYNAVLTGMWSQEETMHYANASVNVLKRQDHAEETKRLSKRQRRKQEKKHEEEGPRALRVTQPRDGQLETYYLTLPWSTSVPLLISSVAMHWFISQALFLLRVAVFSTDGVELPEDLISTVGYSSSAILAVIMTLFVQLLAIMGIGFFRKYDMTMPLVGACSAAIAAITQPLVSEDGTAQFEDDLDVKQLYWGVVGTSSVSTTDNSVRNRKFAGSHPTANLECISLKDQQGDGDDSETVHEGFEHYQHATFSSNFVEPLVGGRIYA